MNDWATLVTEWETEILLLEKTLWQATTQVERTVTIAERQRLQLRLRTARQSQARLYGLAPLAA